MICNWFHVALNVSPDDIECYMNGQLLKKDGPSGLDGSQPTLGDSFKDHPLCLGCDTLGGPFSSYADSLTTPGESNFQGHMRMLTLWKTHLPSGVINDIYNGKATFSGDSGNPFEPVDL